MNNSLHKIVFLKVIISVKSYVIIFLIVNIVHTRDISILPMNLLESQYRIALSVYDIANYVFNKYLHLQELAIIER